MSDAKKVSNLQACNSPSSNDLFLISSVTSNGHVSKNVTKNNLLVSFDLKPKFTSTPASESVANNLPHGTLFSVDENFLYIVGVDGNLKKIPLLSFDA